MRCLPVLLGALLPAVALAGPSTLIVGYEDDDARDGLDAPAAALGGRIERCFDGARVCLIEATRPERAASALARLPGVRYVEHDRPILPAPPLPSTAGRDDSEGTGDCPDLWELDAVGAADAWAIADGTWAPVVAIQDTGFLLTHEELTDRVSGTWDYGSGDPNPEVEWDSGVPAHGSFIAGMLSADPGNGVGRAGLAPYGQLNLQKIADNDGELWFSYAIAAMDDLADGDLGVRVLSYSIAGPSWTQGFSDAVAALEPVGILLVTAAANCGSPSCADADNDANPVYPGSFSYEHIVTVASSTRDDELNPYSHYGAWSVDLAAPGVDLCSLGVYADDDYYTAGGTSYATPLVAATAALLLEANPDLSTTELARVLRASARETVGLQGLVRSGGVLDAAAALRTAVPRLAPPPATSVDGEATLDLVLVNAAAEGDGCLVLTHPEALEFAAALEPGGQCWERTSVGPGEPIELLGAGEVTIDADRLTRFCGPVPAHGATLLELVVRGRAVGSWWTSVRLALTSEGADYLNAPYAEGEADPTGFLAWPAVVTVQQTTAAQDDPCAPEPDDDDAVDDDDSATDDDDSATDDDDLTIDDDDDAVDDDSVIGDDGPGCDCAAAGGRPSSLPGALGLVVLIGIRRRRRSGGAAA